MAEKFYKFFSVRIIRLHLISKVGVHRKTKAEVKADHFSIAPSRTNFVYHIGEPKSFSSITTLQTQ